LLYERLPYEEPLEEEVEELVGVEDLLNVLVEELLDEDVPLDLVKVVVLPEVVVATFEDLSILLVPETLLEDDSPRETRTPFLP